MITVVVSVEFTDNLEDALRMTVFHPDHLAEVGIRSIDWANEPLSDVLRDEVQRHFYVEGLIRARERYATNHDKGANLSVWELDYQD